MSNDEELPRTAKRLDYAELFDRVRKMKEDRVPEANAPVPDAPPATPPVDVAWLAAAKKGDCACGGQCSCHDAVKEKPAPVGPRCGDPGDLGERGHARAIQLFNGKVFSFLHGEDENDPLGWHELSDDAIAWFFATVEYFKSRFGMQRTFCHYYVNEDEQPEAVAEVENPMERKQDSAVVLTLYSHQPKYVASPGYLRRTACHEAMHLLLSDYYVLGNDRRLLADKWDDLLRVEHGIIHVMMECLAADDFWEAAPKFPLDTKTRTKIHFAASR